MGKAGKTRGLPVTIPSCSALAGGIAGGAMGAILYVGYPTDHVH